MSDIGPYRFYNNSPTFRRPQTLLKSSNQIRINTNESNNHNLHRKPSFKQKLFSIFKNSKFPQPNSTNESYIAEDNKAITNFENSQIGRSQSLCLNSKRNSNKLKHADTSDNHIKQLDDTDLTLIDKFNIHPLNGQIIRYITDLQCSPIKLPTSWINKMGSHLTNSVVIPFISIVPGLLGIENHGNTCYVNVIIQCLSHIDNVAEYFSTKDYLKHVKSDNHSSPTTISTESASGFDVMVGFSYLLQSLWQSTYQGKISMKFCQLLTLHKSEFSIDSQQDAHELLLFMLNLLHDNLLEKIPCDFNRNLSANSLVNETDKLFNETSFIYERFRGWLSNEIVCPECNYTRKTLDQILSLNLQIPKQINYDDIVDNNHHLGLFYMVVINPNQIPEKHAFEINSSTTIGFIREVIAARLFCNKYDVIIIELVSGGFGKLFSDDDIVITVIKKNINFGSHTFDAVENGLYATCIPNQVVDVDALQIETTLENDVLNSYKKRKEGSFNQPFIRILVVHVERKDSITDVNYDLSRFGQSDETDGSSSSNDQNAFFNQNHYSRFTNILTVQAARKTNLNLLRHSLSEQMFKYFNLINITKLPRPRFIIGGSHIISEKDVFPLTHESVSKDLSYSTELCGEDSAHVRLVVVWPNRTTNRLKLHNRRIRESSRSLSLNPHKISNHPSVRELKAKQTQENSDQDSNRSKSQNKINITDCLREFFSLDTLSITESWKCPNCQTSQPAKTEIRIQEAPETLILMLKRFTKQAKSSEDLIDKRSSSRNEQIRTHFSNTYTSEGYKLKNGAFSKSCSTRSRDCLNKLEGLIDYPLTNLDLKPFMENISDDNNYLYDLVGVVNHRGSLFNGHYVAICHNSIDNKWRVYDDDRVTEIHKSDVVQPDAYILFYKRQEQQTENFSNLHWSYRRLTFPDKIHRNHSPSPTSFYSKQSRYSDKESVKTLDTYATLPLSIINNHSSKHSFKPRYSPDLFEESIQSPLVPLSDISIISLNNDQYVNEGEPNEIIDISKIRSEIIDVDSLSLDSSIMIDTHKLKTTSSNDSCTKSLNEDSGTALSHDFSCPVERKKHNYSLDNNSKDECYNSFSTSPSTSSPTTSNTY